MIYRLLYITSAMLHASLRHILMLVYTGFTV